MRCACGVGEYESPAGEYASPAPWAARSYPAAHLYIIAFGATDLARVRTYNVGESVWNLAMSTEVVATEFTVPTTLPGLRHFARPR